MRSSQPISSEIPEKFEEIIRLAGNHFKEGKQVQKEFRHLLMEPEKNNLHSDTTQPIYKGTFTYPANCITNSNFIASTGPQDEDAMIKFIEFLLENPFYKVVALGSCLSRNDSYKDFYDYCTQTGETNYYPYQVITKVATPDNVKKMVSGQVSIENILQSELSIHSKNMAVNKNLVVTVFSLRDNQSINLTDDDNKECLSNWNWESWKDKKLTKPEIESILNERKETLWNIFQASVTTPIIVHCSAGVGRTGHFILMMEILKNYASIFSKASPQEAANEINSIVETMRKHRPTMIYTKEQFNTAIRNAYRIRAYALEKEYIKVVNNKAMPTKRKELQSLGIFVPCIEQIESRDVIPKLNLN